MGENDPVDFRHFAKLRRRARPKGVNRKIVILCRMLFMAKPGGRFRRPYSTGILDTFFRLGDK
jgi:hypothetical protein